MRKLAMPAAMLLLFTLPARAAEIRVLTPGLVGSGIVTLAERWGAATGNKVSFPSLTASVGKIKDFVQSGEAYDLLLLPSDDLNGLSGKFTDGSVKPVGRVVFALAVKAGAPHPDISTLQKFRAALAGKTVTYNDPALGSLAGKMVGAMLKQPAYASVKPFPHRGPSADAVVAGQADMAVAVQSEEVIVSGIDIVGPVPDGAGLTLDVKGAVLANAPHPSEAAAFLAYITRPETAAVWAPTGIALIKP